MTDKPYSKIEEEIIEILDQMEDKPAPEQPSNLVHFRPRPKAKRQMPAKPHIQSPGMLQTVRRYSAGSWVGVGIVAALVAWQLGRFVPVLGLIGMLVSIGAFMAAIYTRQTGTVPGLPTASPTTKRWRGRDIDLSQPRTSKRTAKNRWWGGRFRRPRA